MIPPAIPEEVTDLPPDVALIFQFVNTDDRRAFTAHGTRLRPRDRLATAEELERWLLDHGLLALGRHADDAHLHRARDLRQALRAALDPAHHDVPEAARLGFDFDVQVTRDGAGLVLDADPATSALAQIAATAVTITANGTWPRLKTCPAPDCQWVFYDQSKPGRGRWCSPQLCGNRAKTRGYRRRIHDS
ncbi:CGNR zinc finger domain-containing protein [Actinomadura fulvescens]|uniref:CGNR zinc finger domain-containing protein n=1 Tax=Actinomadura fulvescens TaxID=46160 RepID=UPI0031E01E99